MKLNNTEISIISNNKIISNKPLFIDCEKNILRIWNTEPNQNLEQHLGPLTYICFDDGETFESECAFLYFCWMLEELKSITKITIIGDNNQIELTGNIFPTEMKINVQGNNEIKM